MNVCILHSAQREQPLGIHARKVGPHGAGARGKQQLIIRVFKHGPGGKVAYGYRLALRVNCQHLVEHLHPNAKAPPETFRCLKGKL